MLKRFPLLLAASLSVIAFALPSSAFGANSFGLEMFGFSPGGQFQDQSSETTNADLDAMQAAGGKWIRVDVNWAQIQRNGPTSYDWSVIDRIVNAASSRGIHVLGQVGYTPSWARPSGTKATYGPDPATFATFAGAAARHLSGLGVHAYEIWNEPNQVNAWTPAPSPVAYAALLQQAYPAIKAGDPQATVVAGGSSPAPTDGTNFEPVDFLKGMYANGAGGYFDAVAHHPYTWPALPGEPYGWSPWYKMYGTTPSLRSVMIANGDGAKRIWGTEFGAPTNGPAGSFVTEDFQAQIIARAYAEWSTYDWAGPLFVYGIRDHGTDPTYRSDWFGLLRYDYAPKPAYAAFQAAVAAATPVPLPDPEPEPEPTPPADTQAPSVTAVGPANGAAGLATSSTVTVTFDEPMDQASAQAAFSLVRNGDSTPVSGSSAWTGNTLTFTPAMALQTGSTYTAKVGGSADAQAARDLAGNALAAATTWSFSTAAPPPLPPSPAPSGRITLTPSALSVLTGTLVSGSNASLVSADDNLYYEVQSRTTGTKSAAWQASFAGVPRTLSELRISSRTRNSLTATQTISVWNWNTGSWIDLENRSVGSSELLAQVTQSGNLGAYVGGTSSTGELRVRVRGVGSKAFTTSGDLLTIDYPTP